ncbi:MAG: hypothetical protein O9302_00225 [Cyclobacteriaceae bacterium]|jgi:hypothetical protein|nr:hypothetical protein [Cytophagales bacterium]MCZ8326456.1 hypothetical protein [Cyclobacteriaceae bacterium]
MQKARILNRKSIDQLFFHIIDGFKSSHDGLKFIKAEHVITESEYLELLEKNAERLIERIRDFRIANKILSLFFACLFGYMQMQTGELEMRRPGRVRTSTRARVRNRRNESSVKL